MNHSNSQFAVVSAIALAGTSLPPFCADSWASPSVRSTGLRSPPPPQPASQSPVESNAPNEARTPSSSTALPDSGDTTPPLRQIQSAPPIEEAGSLNLICFGGGAANKATVATAYGWGNSSGMVGSIPFHASGSSTATIIGQRSQGFEDQIALRLDKTEGRVRMPRTMLPPIHGGEDGWFKLKSIKVKQHEITATVGVNFMNSPKLRLDRYTGMISISGKAGDFVGQCQRFSPENTDRKF